MARTFQPQGWGQFEPGKGARICEILLDRRLTSTLVELEDGSTVETRDTGYGRDVGEDWEHIYTNIGVEGAEVRFISTSEVVRLVDPESGSWLYQRAE